MGLALGARLPGFIHEVFDSDEGAIATMGMVIARGGVVYRDVIDRKPPIPGFVYAASFLLTGSRDLRPLHVVAAVCLGASALVLAYAATRVAGRTAGWWAAGLLIAGATAMRSTDSQAANFAHLALLPGCGAIVAARSGSRRSAVLAGVLVGIATLTRQTWIIGAVPAAFAAWWWGGRRVDRPLLVLAATAATVAAIGLVVPFDAFWHWTFSGNESVLAVGQSRMVLQRGALVVELFVAANLVTCWLVARRGWRREDLDLWLWLGAGLIAFTAGFRFFGHYWFQVLPPLCLLGGLGAAKCSSSTRRVLVVLVAAPALAAWAIAFSARGVSNTPVSTLAEYVRTHTRSGDLVTIWGSVPEVYWLSGRAPGGAMVTSDFVTGKAAWHADGPQTVRDATPGALDAFLSSLRAHPSELFLDTSTSRIRHYSKYPLSVAPRVQSFVRSHYVRVGIVVGVTVYRLRRSAHPTARSDAEAQRDYVSVPDGEPGSPRPGFVR
jgi:4-amino-4-deoxy-L-arabinose transferase-like glycosyltransferase